MSALTARKVLAGFDAIALQQLCAEAARLAAENEQLREQLYWAESAAMSWRDDALQIQEQLCEQTGAQPGLCVDGSLTIVGGVSA